MIEVVLVGGFLGAGKTTWLSRTLEEVAGDQEPADAALIVNDFAAEGVDDWLLRAACPASVKVYPITSGCICCDRLHELLSCLLSIVQKGHKPGDAYPSRIFIETSGLANPAAILRAVSEHGVLAHNLRLQESVVVLDGLSGWSALNHQALVREQLRSADRIVITKTDLVPERDLELLARRVAQAFPGASIKGSSLVGEFPLPISFGPAEITGHAAETESVDWAPQATVLELSSSTIWEEYALWLAALLHSRPNQILRTKGVIPTPAGPLVLQSVGGIVQPPAVAPMTAVESPNGNSRMVFITEGLDTELLKASFRKYVPSAVCAG